MQHRISAICVIGLLVASCSEIAPVPFTSIEGNWAPRGATCDETALYFQFHEGLALRLARYEPASDFLFHYHDVLYQAPAKGQSNGSLSMMVNMEEVAGNSKDWEKWSFTYHMNGRLSLASINGSETDKAEQEELVRRFSLEKCTIDQLHEIEGQNKATNEQDVTVPASK